MLTSVKLVEVPKSQINLKELRLNIVDCSGRLITDWTRIPFWQHRGHIITNGNTLSFNHTIADPVSAWGIEVIGPGMYGKGPFHGGTYCITKEDVLMIYPHNIELKL